MDPPVLYVQQPGGNRPGKLLVVGGHHQCPFSADKRLEQLDERRRGLIRTAFFDGATYEELAARIGAPLGSVKSWIRRGLMQLKTCLET